MFVACKHTPLTTEDVTEVTPATGGNGGPGGSSGIACDPDTVYFNNTILPLFVSNCAKSGCHDAASAQEGIILDSYANIINTGEIEPFDPDGGHIVDVITENDPDKIMPQPPNQPLSQQQINQIVQWINQGAQNNFCNACDTGNVTFSGKVKPILDLKCVGCHNNSIANGSVNLSTHAGVHAVALSGQLYGAISHTPGYSFMPKNSSQLPQCEIDAIKIWIDSGAPAN